MTQTRPVLWQRSTLRIYLSFWFPPWHFTLSLLWLEQLVSKSDVHLRVIPLNVFKTSGQPVLRTEYLRGKEISSGGGVWLQSQQTNFTAVKVQLLIPGGRGGRSNYNPCRPTSLQSKFMSAVTAVIPHPIPTQMQWGLTAVQVYVCSDCSQTPPPPNTVRPNCSPSSCLQ